MKRPEFLKPFLILFLALILGAVVDAQHSGKHPRTLNSPTAGFWKPVDVGHQDLFLGPGGAGMQPDLSNITFIEERKGGYSKKFVIKDATGNKWVAKVGREAQSETAAVRFLSASGYPTEVNYLVPPLTIPGKGTFTNVRSEA